MLIASDVKMAMLSHRNYSQTCLVVNGCDGNGLQLENFCFKDFALVSQIKSVKTEFG